MLRSRQLFVSGIGIGLLAGLGINQTSENQVISDRLQRTYQYISPLLECNTSSGYSNSIKNLEKQIDATIKSELADQRVNLVSVYFRDLNNGPWFGSNEEVLFSPASLIKVPLMIAYLKLSEDDAQVLQQLLTVTNVDYYQDQYFQPKTKLELGKQYSVMNLIKQMITYSDNVAYETLLQGIDSSYLESVYAEFGIDLSQSWINPDGNILSVKEYAAFFRILYNASYLSEKNSEVALQLLTQSDFADGLEDGVPTQVEVAHKFGERRFLLTDERQLHDCGIVYAPEHPYLLCVMTRGTDFEKLGSVISALSRVVYEAVSSGG